MGPLISGAQLAKSIEIVKLSTEVDGLSVLSGGARMAGASPLDGFDLSAGYFFPPTILGGPGVLKSRVWREEVFGPVICVTSFVVRRRSVAGRDLRRLADTLTSLTGRGRGGTTSQRLRLWTRRYVLSGPESGNVDLKLYSGSARQPRFGPKTERGASVSPTLSTAVSSGSTRTIVTIPRLQ